MIIKGYVFTYRNTFTCCVHTSFYVKLHTITITWRFSQKRLSEILHFAKDNFEKTMPNVIKDNFEKTMPNVICPMPNVICPMPNVIKDNFEKTMPNVIEN
jgi:hypothetical protein